jgi:hypothetical protein
LTVAEGALQEQCSVAVGGGGHRDREVLCGVLLLVAERPRRPEERVGDRLGGAFEIWVAALVEPDGQQRLEQRGVVGGEPDVGAGRRGEPIGRRHSLAGLQGERRGKGVGGADRGCGEQLVAVGEVPVGGGDTHAQSPARLRQ